jgi:hypothetical protein
VRSRSAARGDLTSGADIELATDQLAGPVYYRVLITGQPVSQRAYTDALVDHFLAAADTHGNGRGPAEYLRADSPRSIARDQ